MGKKNRTEQIGIANKELCFQKPRKRKNSELIVANKEHFQDKREKRYK
jgi:hypothetical protein